MVPSQTRAPDPTLSKQLHLAVLAELTPNCSLIHLPWSCIHLENSQTKQNVLVFFSQHRTQLKQWHLKELVETQLVIWLTVDPSVKKKSTTRRSLPNMEIKEAALNSETIWTRSVGFQHPSDGKVCAYDWLASISDKGCTWHRVLAGSDEAIRALALKQTEMLWHNLAAGLTEEEKSFGGQKVCSLYWHEQQSAQMNTEGRSVWFMPPPYPSSTLIKNTLI